MLILPISEDGSGTYNYRENWIMLDHIIVSNNIIKNNKA